MSIPVNVQMLDLLNRLNIKPARATAIVSNELLMQTHGVDRALEHQDKILAQQLIDLLWRSVKDKSDYERRMWSEGMELRMECYIMTFRQMMELLNAAYAEGVKSRPNFAHDIGKTL